MINLKKVGVSALAGSLAMFAVNAGEMGLKGSAEATYTSNSGAGTSLGGNPYGLSHDVQIFGSGEMDNGWAYSINSDFQLNDMGADSSMLKIDMGGLGLLGLDQGSGGFGIGTLEQEVPTAYEEASHAVGTLSHGIDRNGAMNVIGYSNSLYGFGISIEYNPEITATTAQGAGAVTGGVSEGSELNYAITYVVPSVEGLTLAFGEADTNHGNGNTLETSEIVAAVNYTVGAIKAGFSMSEVTTLGNVAQDNVHFGVAFNVNDSLSVSYNTNDAQKYNIGTAGGAENVEKSRSVNAAYALGGASARLVWSKADNVGGVLDVKDENLELSLALAF
jgi:outer membrane protein OmpU